MNHDAKNRQRTNLGAKNRHVNRNILSLVEGMLIRNGESCKNATLELISKNPREDPLLYEFPIWVHLGTSVR